MKMSSSILFAALAAACLAGARASSADAPVPAAPATPSGSATTAETLPAGLDPAGILPGASLSALTPSQRQVVLRVAQDEFCYCGCPHTLAGCLKEHKQCLHAPRMLALTVRLASGGLTAPEILKLLTQYYASFDAQKRHRLDTKDFGPPLGRADAPVSIVEFSDFTCPYCRQLRPRLEEFVRSHEGQVKLYFKPFPLQSHARSFEAAEAGEWARDRGIFWPMHDALFEHPHELSDDDLATRGGQLGSDPADLRAALETRRHRARIQASQREALDVGLTATPTLYFDGRRFVLPDYSDANLEFTLQDEQEWKKNGGWAKD